MTMGMRRKTFTVMGQFPRQNEFDRKWRLNVLFDSIMGILRLGQTFLHFNGLSFLSKNYENLNHVNKNVV